MAPPGGGAARLRSAAMADDPAAPAPPRPPRRPRYQGTHPRRFSEKYKERDPERYVETAGKVAASGKTPAGSHRPVLVAEVLAALDPKPGEVAVDATLGYGGHAAALLPRLLPGGRLVGLDVDPVERPRTEARLRSMGFGPEVLTVVASNFAGLPKVLAAEGLAAADLVLADLGVSSMQLDDPSRGFTFKEEGPLDLRMNPNRGLPASALLARLDAAKLEKLLDENSDEPHAARIAAAICEARRAAPITTTSALADAVRSGLSGLPRRVVEEEGTAPLSRVFQALRIAVNEEFTALEAFLAALPSCLLPGGRAAILTFHSGEDRRVKQAFREGERIGLYAAVSPEVVRASPEERRANPRSAPAKLRWALRAGR
jgi:16S rRNA (cytosine1402-N4)-methyltransferase